MYVTIWQHLGISPTRSENAIREAYVQAVKQCHPEDKPEEWALLHDAYLQALRFARGDLTQNNITSSQPADVLNRNEGPEPEYSDDFRAALADSQEIAARVLSVIQDLEKKRGPISCRQIRPLTEMLFELRPNIDGDINAASEALRFFSARLFTREAYNVIIYDLQEWYYALPQTALRAEIKTTINKVEKLQKAANEKNQGGKDALFSWGVAVISMMILVATMDGGAFFAIIAGTFCFGMAYRLKSKQGLFIPDEKRARRIWRTILTIALVMIMIGAHFGCRYFARQGVNAIYEQVENTYADYDPSLNTGKAVSLELSQEPSFVGLFMKSSELNASRTSYSTNKTIITQANYYDAIGINGQRVLIYVEDTYMDDFSDLQMPCTIYGKVSTLVTDGSFLPKPFFEFMFEYDAQQAVDVMLESSRSIREELTAAAEEIGGNPVFRYTASEPGVKSVLSGYESGRYPYCICWSICFGCVVHLILMLSRSINLKKKLFVE